ncbi:MAG: hypothetical protein IK123_04315 [Lachnospiraceae bacterium]|nr:hypothetical protein [Lachnospiraceae bacterium]
MITIFGEVHLSRDGAKLIWDDYYFSDEAEEGNVAFYHNTTGEFDAEQSERIRLSDEAFWEMIDDYEAGCGLLKWTPIAEFYTGSEDNGDEWTESKDENAMHLYMDYFRDPTAKNWNTFMKTAPDNAVLFIINNPPEDMKDLISDTVVIDKDSSDILIAVALDNYTQIDLESGEMVLNDRGAMLWNPDPDGKLYSEQLDKGFLTCFRMTIPEGAPSRCLNIKTENASGMYPVVILNGRWDQRSTFVKAFKE